VISFLWLSAAASLAAALAAAVSVAVFKPSRAEAVVVVIPVFVKKLELDDISLNPHILQWGA
jgi:formaldehyde-activating enzyme involved in methanogenesis